MRYLLILALLSLSSGCAGAYDAVHRGACVICNLTGEATYMCLKSGLSEKACKNPKVLAEFKRSAELATKAGHRAAMNIMLESLEE